MPDDEDQAQEAGDTTEHDTANDDRDTAQEADNDRSNGGEQDTEDKNTDGETKKLKAQWEKANREAAGLRKRLKELEPLAKRAKELEDAQKTEVEKLNDQLAATQVELQGLRVEKIRRDAATAAGDPELAEFITAADEETAREQAERLAERFKKAEPKRPDLKQGARTQPAQQMTRDDLVRGLAGYGRR